MNPRIAFTNTAVPEFTGNLSTIGYEYGEYFRLLIEGFMAMETPPLPSYQKLAERSLSDTKKYTPRAAQLISGLALGAQLRMVDVMRLFLHEEIYHLKSMPQTHCSAIVYPGTLTRCGGGLVGQNWDWPLHYIPWGGLVRLSPRNLPSNISYHYPGLISCCGINSSGFSIMWTGGGYYPVIRPQPGVPTYAIIFELLLKKSVKEAIAFVRNIPRAGSFIFALADARGKCCVIEATPRQISIDVGENAHFRANLFGNPSTIAAAHQQTVPSAKIHSIKRMRAMKREIGTVHGKITAVKLQKILFGRDIFVDLKGRSRTLAQFVADCRNGVLYCRDGSCDDSPWRRFKV